MNKQQEIETMTPLTKHSAHSESLSEVLVDVIVRARSCERFKVLSENITDPELAAFYHELMISEATHYTMFLGFARKYDTTERVDKRWQDFLNYESEIISSFGVKETIHG